MTKKQHGILVIILLFCFSIWPTFLPLSNPFSFTSGGFCLEWFIVLYFISAYIQKYGLFNFKTRYWLLAYMCLSILILFIWLVLSRALGVTDFSNEWKGSFNFWFYKYNSFFVVLSSICLFRLFLNLNITNPTICKIIKFAAPLMIGVYLITDNKLGREYIWRGLTTINEANLPILIYMAVYFVLLFLLCIIIDWVRSKLFRLLDNRIWYKELLAYIDDIPSCIYNRINKIGSNRDNN